MPSHSTSTSRLSETGKCILTWHGDGTVTKALSQDSPGETLRARFDYEARINTLLAADPPPVPFPRMVVQATDQGMRFEAVPGEPCGPKWPETLDLSIVGSMVGLARRLEHYRPTASWVRVYNPLAELETEAALGVLEPGERQTVEAILHANDWPTTFAHGDLTPRNVLWTDAGPVLIDWELAGWYPCEYDVAFLWIVLVELPEARALVESAITEAHRRSFWMCAYMIQVHHLSMYSRRPIPSRFLSRHLETKSRCLTELVNS